MLKQEKIGEALYPCGGLYSSTKERVFFFDDTLGRTRLNSRSSGSSFTIEGVKVIAYGFKDFSLEEAQLYFDYVDTNVEIPNNESLSTISISPMKNNRVAIRLTTDFGYSQILIRGVQH